LLNVHVTTVQALEREGKLHGAKELRGATVYTVYDDAEVEALIKSGWRANSPKAGRKFREKAREGFREGKAVRMFNEGKGPWQIAESLGYTMEEASELWRRWKLGPKGLLAEKQMEAMAIAELEWTKEMVKDRRRKEWLDHTKRLAEIRASGRVPTEKELNGDRGDNGHRNGSGEG